MPGTSGLPLAGVEAIVESLSQFQGDVKKMNSALDSIRPRATLLQDAFSSAWEIVKGFGREVLNVAEYALGHILADALEFVVTEIRELVSATIDAGAEFQTLELRLQRLNFNTLVESGMDFNEAQREAVELTKEQLTWLQKLAAQTPYDNTDISNVFTLARSYGFASKEAMGLTEDIANFAAGMGLGNTEIERIIVNFGQMVQQGKVTQREMTDLARGSFVPVNDILERMQKNVGMTDAEFKDFRSTQEGVNAFMVAFSQIVKERFAGASQQMAQTFKAAGANALDMVKSIGGLNVVKPILDVLGKRIADFVSAFTDNPERWNQLVGAATRIGDALSKVIGQILDLAPGAGSLADMLVAGVEKFATWINENSGNIVQFFKDVGDTIKNDVIPWIRDNLIPALERFFTWIDENGPTIKEFFNAVGKIISDFFSDLTSQPGQPKGGGDFLDSITKFMQFVIDHTDEITKWVEVLWSAFIVWQVLATIFNVVLSVVITVIGFVLSLSFAWTALTTVLGIVGSTIGALITTILAIIGPILLVIAAIASMWFAFNNIKAGLTAFWETIKQGWNDLANFAAQKVIDIQNAFRRGDWIGIGKAMIDGIVGGIKMWYGTLISAVVAAVSASWNAAKKFLGIHSPSKLFMDIGGNMMEGMAMGIEQAVGAATSAMQGAVASVAMPALSSMAAAQGGGNTITNNRSANLTINTSAPMEPIVQDFNMLQSLMGA